MSIPPGQALRSGKAFKYAVAKDLEAKGIGKIAQSEESKSASQAYGKESEEEKEWLDRRARAANEHLLSIEPRLRAGGLTISVRPDQAGIDGDVRDVVLAERNSDWELGLSVKRKHEALEHTILSPGTDFGQEWGLGQKCSQEYWDAVSPAFARLKCPGEQGQPWPSQKEASAALHGPVMEAFRREAKKICDAKGKDACGAVFRHLVGRKDSYRVIAQDDNVKIQAFNFSNKLAVGRNLKPPRRLVSGGPGENGEDSSFGAAVVLIFDQGWTLKLRACNEKRKADPSLKLGVLLRGQPTNLYTHTISAIR